MADNYFKELYSKDVSKYTEKKNGLTYLSWAYAWAEIKKAHPDATYTVYEQENGCIYWTDGKTCWVKTGVTVDGIEHIEYLPVMNYKNQSIPLTAITSMDVNKTIQRSLTKACARHGLGLYVYAGEDLPEDATEMQDEKGHYGLHGDKTPEDAKANQAMIDAVDKDLVPTQDGKVTTSQIKRLKAEMERTGYTEGDIAAYYKHEKIAEMTQAQVIMAIRGLLAKPDKEKK